MIKGLLLMLSLASLPVTADEQLNPKAEFLRDPRSLGGSLRTMEQMLQEQILTLAGIAKKDVVSEVELHQALSALPLLKSIASEAGLSLRSLRNSFESTKGTDAFVIAKAKNVDANFYGAFNRLDEIPPVGFTDVDQLVGDLRSFYFVLNNTSGNLILLLSEAAKQYPPNVPEAQDLRKVLSTYVQVFRDSARQILGIPKTAVGRRRVNFVAGRNAGSLPEMSTERLSAHEATKAEARLVRALAVEVAALHQPRKMVDGVPELFNACAGVLEF